MITILCYPGKPVYSEKALYYSRSEEYHLKTLHVMEEESERDMPSSKKHKTASKTSQTNAAKASSLDSICARMREVTHNNECGSYIPLLCERAHTAPSCTCVMAVSFSASRPFKSPPASKKHLHTARHPRA